MIQTKIDHFFLQEYAKLVSVHTSIFGVHNLELIEDAVQDALFDATELWRFSGMPKNPAGWLYKVSKNKCLDKLKYQKVRQDKQNDVVMWYEDQTVDNQSDSVFNDEQLVMMFTCAHPTLKQDDQITLTLKILCGFSSQEIARAFLSNKKTIEQHIVRAKRKLRDEHIKFEKPTESEIENRLSQVLKTIYLLFNEGYHSNSGEEQIRKDLCIDALRLTDLLLDSPLSKRAETYALQALLFFQMSRFDARHDDNGDIVLLEEQDRSKWDQYLIRKGLTALEKSSSGRTLTEYHLQAGIAACHAISESDQSTDWKQIVSQYDLLIQMNPNPIYKLNAAVARYMNKEKLVALDILNSLKSKLNSYYLYPAVMGEIYFREKQFDHAKTYFSQALDIVENESFKRFLQKKKALCET